MDYNNDKIIHAPTYFDNKVMQLFELDRVDEHK